MIPITNITGRLGNQMFQFAALYARSRELGIDRYFQDPKFFEKYESEIKSIFGTNIGFLSCVSIHVRRTDYINHINNFYIDLTKTDYYEKAIAIFPNKNFLVFSDDPEFCKTLPWITDKFQVLDMGDQIDDLNLMASCESNIIANSSYSWWAGYLNPNPGKKVVAPTVKNWHTDGIERTVCPKEWIRI